MVKIAVLASGSGTNADNIARYFSASPRARVVACIVNRPEAPVIDKMRLLNIPCYFIPSPVIRKQPEELLKVLSEVGADIVVLAGFDLILPASVVQVYRGRIVNIHPSLLPAYGGKGMVGHHVHEAVIANGETRSGVTVHHVTEEPDAGSIILQQEVEITPEDTPETLEAKIHPVEYAIYPRAIELVIDSMATPPPVPTPEEEWAKALQVDYDEKEAAARAAAAQTPPPYQQGQVPPYRQGQVPPYQQGQMPPYQQGQMPQYQQGPVPPYPQGGVYRQRPMVNGEPMPKTYLVWSVLAVILCCLPAGIVAIIFSAQVSSKYYAGNLEGSRRASERAQLWIILSIVLGVLTNILYLPFLLLLS